MRKREGYDLVDSLLNLSKSEDGRVAVKACEGLMLLVSLNHKDAARVLVQDTALCYLLNLRWYLLASNEMNLCNQISFNFKIIFTFRCTSW